MQGTNVQRIKDGAPRASIKDVALRAGVSPQTVSRVANGYAHVRPEKREKVLEAMRELGYRPNSAARNLKSGRFRSLGVVAFNITTLGNERTLEAVAEAGAEAGYTTTLIPVADPTRLNVAGAFGRLEEQAVDGIILIMSAEFGSPDDYALTAGLPLVIVDSTATAEHTLVDTDQEQGARTAMQHLLDLGHRRIAHVAGPLKSFSARRREDAYARVCQEHALDPTGRHRGNWTADSGYAAGRGILAEQPRPTAVFAANDQMALGVMRAAHEAGLRIPEDLSVIGFDDSDDSGSYWPPLSTIHQHFDVVGQRATELLIAMIDGEPLPENPLIPTRLVVRESTGPAPATA
ncbi:MAG: LacI family transcriptional regulator [Microbacterium sp.]|jgi:DNA-binding LacI/PurR family transcriptional regulator|uniref:LacI family DNA-binding transcriptional regulator n=1 Tax=Microbacterium sp. TaxID=51671 RepID=UPI00282B79F8|nr:LacI family DNA-binding transcriptional regulator [Microbacterium sp.]MDR2321523.1 LacI family transcriptional regulator [Microbacterium sp.]